MNINDLMQRAASIYDSGNHAEIADLFEPLLGDAEYSSVFLYCAGLAHVMSGSLVKGLTHFASIIRKSADVSDLSTNAQSLSFPCYAAMQAALIAEFNLHHDHALMSAFAEKAATFAKDAAEITGFSDIFKGAADILARIYYTPSGMPFLMPSSPPTLQVEPTNICNFKCIMCPRSRMGRPEGFMSLETWDNIFKGWSAKYSSLNFTHLILNRPIRFSMPGSVKFFFLGEPLLHPEFDAFISKAASEGCRVSVQTNGSLLVKPDFAERLLDSGVHEIGISVDGINKETYSTIRKGAEWERTVSGIRKLLDARCLSGSTRKSRIEISTIISDNDASLALRTKEFMAEMFDGVDLVRFINLDRSYSPVFIDENGEVRSPGKLLHTSYSSDSPLCMEPFLKLNILWDGNVTPCCHDIDGIMSYGSVVSEKIDEIWRNQAFSRLLQALSSHDLSSQAFCRSCRFPSS